MTPLSAMAARDSAVMVVDLARLASGLPNDTTAAFRGLPVVTRSAVRMRVEGADLVFAEVTRRVGQEATPLEERVAFIAERDTTPGARWMARWSERVAGSEETIEATDVVGVVRVGAAVALVLQRESARGARYELLWREAGAWTRRWAGVWSGC